MSSDGSDGSVTVGAPASAPRQFAQGLGLFDAITVVVGVMIGSGIFIVSADMARLVGSAGWLLVAWAIAGLLTIAGALSYGELSALMPRAGGMYIYLREAFSPLLGFLYGWTLFTVIQTGTIAAVSVAFARFLGVLWPAISEDRYLIPPQLISQRYAVSLSSSQLLALAIIVLVTFTNTRGLQYGKIIQNIFTIAKTGALLALIMLGLFLGRNSAAVHTNFAHTWTTQAVKPIVPGLAATTFFGLLVALCISQTGSLFAADSWHNIAFTASEVRNARRNVTLAGSGVSGDAALAGHPACRWGPRRDCHAAGHFPRRGHSRYGGRNHGFDIWLRERADHDRCPRLLRDGLRRAVFLARRPAEYRACSWVVAHRPGALVGAAGTCSNLQSGERRVWKSV